MKSELVDKLCGSILFDEPKGIFAENRRSRTSWIAPSPATISPVDLPLEVHGEAGVIPNPHALHGLGADRNRTAGDADNIEFLDSFRSADRVGEEELVRDPIAESGALEGLEAGAVNALCREAGIETPEWASRIGSPEPFFAFPARSFALRVRLMIESPPPFRIRNVFVPGIHLSRA